MNHLLLNENNIKIVIDFSMKRTATRLVSILGQDVDVVGEYKNPGIHNNKKRVG